MHKVLAIYPSAKMVLFGRVKSFDHHNASARQVPLFLCDRKVREHKETDTFGLICHKAWP